MHVGPMYINLLYAGGMTMATTISDVFAHKDHKKTKLKNTPANMSKRPRSTEMQNPLPKSRSRQSSA